jgi:dTDP-glucose 4,6-dehydratase/UDP-glucose 4-epimerase
VEALRPADLRGVDTILHFAALKHVARSFADSDTFRRNTAADHHLLVMASRSDVRRVIVASSCEVYGDHGAELIDEGTALDPRSPYAVSKVALEHLARVCQRLRPDQRYAALRFFNVYGPDEYPDAVIPQFIVSLLSKGALTIEGSGLQRRDFSYVDDVIEMLARLFPCYDLPAALNVGAGRSWAIREVAELLTEMVPGTLLRQRPARPNEISGFVASVERLEALIGTVPRTSLNDGVRRCLESPWLRQWVNGPHKRRQLGMRSLRRPVRGVRSS